MNADAFLANVETKRVMIVDLIVWRSGAFFHCLVLNQQQRRWTTKKRILHLGIIESENIYFAATGDNPQLLAPATQARQYNRQLILPSAVPTYETTAASGDGEDARS